MLSYELVGPPAGSPLASAVTLLCLHGNSSHRGVWRLVARELREFRCVLLDFHGHGDSEHVTPPSYNPEHHAEDLARFIASQGRVHTSLHAINGDSSRAQPSGAGVSAPPPETGQPGSRGKPEPGRPKAPAPTAATRDPDGLSGEPGTPVGKDPE